MLGESGERGARRAAHGAQGAARAAQTAPHGESRRVVSLSAYCGRAGGRLPFQLVSVSSFVKRRVGARVLPRMGTDP